MVTDQFKGGGVNPYGQMPSWLNAPQGDSTMALVKHTNPVTGETWTAPGGGYTLNNNMLGEGGMPQNNMGGNNPYALNNAANTAFQSSPSFQNFAYGGTPSNGMGALGGMFGALGGLGGGMPQNNMGGLAGLIQADPNRDRYTDGPMAGGMAAEQNLLNSMRGSYVAAPSGNVTPQGGYGSIFAPNTVDPTRQMSNQNNFNFTPTAIAGSGSYNTADYASLFGGLATGGLAGAAAGAGVNDAIGRLQALGQAGVTDYGNLARASTQGINFTPYALTSSLGSTQQTAPGVISQQLTPQQQSNVNAAQQQQGSLYNAAVPDTSGIANQAFGSAGGYLNPQGNAQMQQLSGMFGNMAQQAGAAYGAPTGLEGTTAQALQGASTGLNQIGTGLGGINQYGSQALAQGTQGLGQIGAGMGDLAGLRGQYGTAASQAAGMLGGSTTGMANQLFQQQQAMRNPEQQRQSAELENRLRAQGRLGTSTAAYGGTPEQLAMARAVQEQQSADAFNSMTQAEQMASSQQARALGLGQATAGMASNISSLTDAQQARALGLGNTGIGAQQAASGLTNEQQSRALGLLSAGQQGTQFQDQLLSSQLGRATSGAQASSALTAANQALRQGDVQTAASLFNIGSSAAQLPQQMQGQNIAQAGQLQGQALAPAAAQLQQAQLSANMGQQQADTAAKAGGLFGDIAGAGLQERLTAESAASATRVKQFDSILKSYADQGGTTGAAANSIQGLINQGVTKVGGLLYSAAGQLLGSAIDVIGEAASSMWDSLTGPETGGGVDSSIIDDIGNSIGDVVSGGIDAVKGAYDYFFGN